MPRLHTAAEQIRMHGVRGAWGLLRSNVCTRTTCLRLQKRLGLPPSQQDLVSGCIKAERGKLEVLEAWRASRKSALPMEFFVDRTRSLRHCYLGYWNGELAHILWLAGAGESSTVSDWAPSEDEIEVRDVHTLADYRQRGIFEQVARTALMEARLQGIKTAYAHVDVRNRASLQAFAGLGFRATHRVSILRVLGFDRIRLKPAGN
jgi:GNAT superfamily N-acetyltransferase